VLIGGAGAHVYAINGQGRNVQMMVSRRRSTQIGPPQHAGDERVHHPRTNRSCIGVAVGAGPEASFIDSHSEPLVCQEPDGSIDASPFVADGRVVLVLNSDGNCCGRPTTL
jgi:hypothetical protein